MQYLVSVRYRYALQVSTSNGKLLGDGSYISKSSVTARVHVVVGRDTSAEVLAP